MQTQLHQNMGSKSGRTEDKNFFNEIKNKLKNIESYGKCIEDWIKKSVINKIRLNNPYLKFD